MIDAFLQLLSPWFLAVSLAGVSLGVIWGALPGLSTTMAMALLIGLSTGMQQASALVFDGQSVGFVLSQYVGTALLVCLLVIFAEGVIRLWRSARQVPAEPARPAQ